MLLNFGRLTSDANLCPGSDLFIDAMPHKVVQDDETYDTYRRV